MIWDLIGVTGWPLPQIMALTFPQLTFLQRGRGRILYARLGPQINANLANLSAKPGTNGEPSEAHKIIHRHQQFKDGVITPPTAEERTLAYARRILLEPYLGDPDAVQAESAAPSNPSRPFPGMGVDEAQAWVEWIKAGRCPDSVWLEIYEVYPNIRAAAQGK
jgi:hypothetical protein